MKQLLTSPSRMTTLRKQIDNLTPIRHENHDGISSSEGKQNYKPILSRLQFDNKFRHPIDFDQGLLSQDLRKELTMDDTHNLRFSEVTADEVEYPHNGAVDKKGIASFLSSVNYTS